MPYGFSKISSDAVVFPYILPHPNTVRTVFPHNFTFGGKRQNKFDGAQCSWHSKAQTNAKEHIITFTDFCEYTTQLTFIADPVTIGSFY